MAKNVEDIINPEKLRRAGERLWTSLFLRRPRTMPIFMAALLVIFWWSVTHPNLGGSAVEGAKQSTSGRDAEKPNNDLGRDLWTQPQKTSYSLKGVYTVAGEDLAIINGQDVKVGDRIGDAKVLEIGINVVKIQEDGNPNPTELRWLGDGLSMEVVQPTPKPKPTEAPKAAPVAEAKNETAAVAVAPVEKKKKDAEEWDWSSWPGPPELIDRMKKEIRDPAKRAEGKAEIIKLRDSGGERPPEFTDEMIDWIIRCIEWHDAHAS